MPATTLRRTSAGLAAAGLATAVALHGQSARAADLQLVAHDEPGNLAFDDLGAPSPHGPDLGDVLAFTQTLSHGSRTVGLVHVAAVVVDHKRHLSEATGTVVLHAGDITVAGVVPQAPTFTLVVTGGTGSYAGASGTLTFAVKAGAQTLTLHLLKR